VTDCSVPYQPFVGRGEALLALHQLFYGKPTRWLESHGGQCLRFAEQMGKTANESSSLPERLQNARLLFERHLAAQGASVGAFHDRVTNLNTHFRQTFDSPEGGFVVYDLAAIRGFILHHQRGESKDRFPDQSGIELLKPPGEPVERGEPILRIRLAVGSRPPRAVEGLFSITAAPRTPFEDRVIERTNHGR
jgi:thymidine phosphorylase